jgi:Domain of unknown function (DUF4159)
LKARKYLVGGVVALGLLAGVVFAQQRFRSSRAMSGDVPVLTDRHGTPEWEVDPQFKSDVFTFVRIKWRSWRYSDTWLTDYPDSDLNFSFRLQQLTSLKVEPKPKILSLTDDELFDYPFIYMLEVGSLSFTEEEVAALRRYLLNGGFLMVDDFWGEQAWENFYQEIKRVFPEREPIELDLTHKIFHCVYDLKELPQIPGIDTFLMYRDPKHTWERNDAKEVHYRGIFDDKGRMMVIICQNTDLGDGWEREGEDETYFREFSEKKAYPLGINIIFWAMTH